MSRLRRNSTLRDLDAEVKAVRVFNFVRKYTMYVRVDNERQEARAFKNNVWVGWTLN